MTNRQARREQRRSQRNQQRGMRNTQRPAPQRSGGGGSSFFSLPYLVGIGVLVLALGGIIVFLAMQDSGSAYAEQLREADEQFPTELAEGNAVGEADAPVTIVSFVDFRCPHCMRFAAEDEPQIIDEYVTEGLVRLETRHMPVIAGDGSVIAAEAAQCALRQDQFWPMHNRLFRAHAEDGTGSSVFDTDAVKGYAADIGLDTEAFNSCIDNRETNEEVQADRAASQSYGFTGTPSFLINETALTGAPSGMDGWRTLLDDLLADLQAGGGQSEGDDGAGTNGEDDANGDATEEEETGAEDDENPDEETSNE